MDENIIQTQLSESLIMLYTREGYGYITEAFPTCYRTFTNRTYCSPDDVDKWVYWTVSQKRNWERNPPVPARRDWLTEAVAKFDAVLNESTGYYEYLTLKDLTGTDMLMMFQAGPTPVNGGDVSPFNGNQYIRSNLHKGVAGSFGITPAIFSECRNIEVINADRLQLTNAMFYNCHKLRSIDTQGGVIYTSGCNSATFQYCSQLVDVGGFTRYSGLYSLDLRWSPLLSAQSVANLIYALWDGTAAKPSTLTVSPLVFAKLNGEPFYSTRRATGKPVELTYDRVIAWFGAGSTYNWDNMIVPEGMVVGDIIAVELAITDEYNAAAFAVGELTNIAGTQLTIKSWGWGRGPMPTGETLGGAEQTQWTAVKASVTERNISIVTP